MEKQHAAGDRLRKWIDRSGSTQVAVAVELGILKSTLNDILSGRRRPSLTLAARIEKLTGIPARDFAEAA